MILFRIFTKGSFFFFKELVVLDWRSFIFSLISKDGHESFGFEEATTVGKKLENGISFLTWLLFRKFEFVSEIEVGGVMSRSETVWGDKCFWTSVFMNPSKSVLITF